MDNLIQIPPDAKRFKAFLCGHTIGEGGGGIGTSAIAVLVGPEPLFDNESGNHGLECEVIIIPKRKLHVAQTTSGDRVRYGDILMRAESMRKDDAWVEKMESEEQKP